MEEQILKIMMKEFAHLNMVQASKVSENVTSMVMEFAIWFACESFEIFEQGTIDDKPYFSDLSGNEITPDEIFDYWFNNIRNK
jgi:hypothetical protein